MDLSVGQVLRRDDIVSLAEKFCEGLKIYNAPIFAFGSADDDLYEKYKSPGVIGAHFLSPKEWLPCAKTVVSFFLPYTEEIKAANRADNRWPSDEWLHGRYEGQILLTQLMQYLVQTLSDMGHESLAPSLEPKFKTGSDEIRFTSNWSERHIAYACGLGTFGLSKGLITRKGICGRFGSFLTSMDFEKDERDYSGVYDYCTMCGVCIHRCPVQAISKENGKNSQLCSDFLDIVREKTIRAMVAANAK
jgi:epoxyqueuosine reductase QueG